MATKQRVFLDSLAVSVGMALATSCFVMGGSLVVSAGVWALAGVALSALLVLGVSRALGRLARRFPSAPGLRTYTKAAFGNRLSLFFVFLYLVLLVLIAVVESALFSSLTHELLPTVPRAAVVAGLFALVFAFNAVGFDFSRSVQLWLVVFMLGGMGALCVSALLGVWQGGLTIGPEAALLSPGAVLPAATVSAFFLYVGFEWVTSAQSGSREAARQLPRVLTAAVGVLALLYALFVGALLAVRPTGLGGDVPPQLLLARAVWGAQGAWLVLALSAAAVLTSFNAGVIGASRLVYSLAREGAFPRALAMVRERSGSPLAAICTIVGLSAAVALGTLGRVDLALAGNVAALVIVLCYGGLVLADRRLERRDGRSPSADATLVALALAALVAALVVDQVRQQDQLLLIVTLAAIALAGVAATLSHRSCIPRADLRAPTAPPRHVRPPESVESIWERPSIDSTPT